ncbi:neprilysin-11-like [Ornithodoros turicata]|uniref:neprilysin-11-like n=1 Tax=Ornithodoros turicata TaxID=34597 RepID=UPI00313890C9
MSISAQSSRTTVTQHLAGKRDSRLTASTRADEAGSVSPVTASRNPRPKRPILPFWLVMFFIAAVATALVVPLVVAILHVAHSRTARSLVPSYSVCASSLCRAYAQEILASLNESKGPCKHFFQYVCDGWNTKHQNTKALQQLSLRSTFAILNMSREAQTIKNQPPSVRATAILLLKCAELQKESLNQMDELTQILSSSGLSWPQQQPPRGDLLNILAHWALVYQVDCWFKLDIRYEKLENRAVVFVHLGESKACSWKSTRQMWWKKGTYGEVVQAFLKESAFEGNETALHSQANYIINMEEKLMNVLCREHPQAVPSTDISDKWRTTIKESLWSIYGNLTPEIVVRYVPGYRSAVDELISQQDHGELAYAITWTIVQTWGPYFSGRLGSLVFGSGDNALSSCVSIVKSISSPNLEYLFGSNIFTDDTRLEVYRMFDNIQDEIFRQINESSWLDSSTRIKAAARIRRIVFEVPLPTVRFLEEMYQDLTIGEDATFASAFQTAIRATRKVSWSSVRESIEPDQLAANAHIYLETLRVIVALAMFQIPLYDPEMPKAIMYPALGHVFAHEIMHAFDANWHRYNEYAEKEDWWTPKVYDKYLEKTACIRRAHQNYQKIFGRQLLPTYDPERFADLAGVPALLDASHKYAPDVRLPGMEHFSRDKQFFIVYCYAHCSSRSSPTEAVHAPAEERCNVPLMNLQAFADTFSCAKGDPMNPQEKCTFW